MLERDDWKIAIEDARHKHAAVVDLIYFTDSQAMGLLRLYATLGFATAAGAAAALFKTPTVPPVVGWALGATTIVLALGSWFCFRAMAPGRISLPGRGADFWVWAAGEIVKRDDAFLAYLTQLAEKRRMNNEINERTSNAMRRAKQCGLALPIVALTVGLVAYQLS